MFCQQLHGTVALDAIGDRFLAWQRSGQPDTGISTAQVLGQVTSGSDLPSVAADYFDSHPRGAAGNGALMRTAPVALAHLGDDAAISGAARAVAELTHADPLAGDSCVLWCLAIDRAIRQDRLDGVRDGVAYLPDPRRQFWSDALTEAEPACHLQDVLIEAVRIGDDTDTVAAIAGMVLGARWGAAAVPPAWRDLLHGWPGLQAADLERLVILTVNGGRAKGA